MPPDLKPGQWLVEVPCLVWPRARQYLTAAEQDMAFVMPHSHTAVFDKECDARAFTHILREEHNVLLPVKEVK